MRDTVGTPWIGVDLDGTLAYYDGWKGPKHIGEPIPEMLFLVKSWIDNGTMVKIFTARVASNNPEAWISRIAINEWCLKHIGTKLPITSEKDTGMIELWDDRCIQVIFNKGVALRDII